MHLLSNKETPKLTRGPDQIETGHCGASPFPLGAFSRGELSALHVEDIQPVRNLPASEHSEHS